MPKKPIVSVVIVSRNCPKYIRKAIDSMRKQTLRDIEIIITDESTDTETRKIIRDIARRDKRVRPFLVHGLGLSGSINNGLRKARGEFIARMDADDISAPTRLTRQVAYLRAHPKLDLIGTWAWLIDKRDKRIGEIVSPPVDDTTFRRRMIITGPWVSPTLMFRRSILKRTGYFDPKFRHAEDYEWMSRALPHITVGNLPEKLFSYRWDFDQNLTFQAGKRTEWNAIRVRWNMVRRHEVPTWYVIYLAKPLAMFLVPTWAKKIVLRRIRAVPKHG